RRLPARMGAARRRGSGRAGRPRPALRGDLDARRPRDPPRLPRGGPDGGGGGRRARRAPRRAARRPPARAGPAGARVDGAREPRRRLPRDLIRAAVGAQRVLSGRIVLTNGARALAPAAARRYVWRALPGGLSSQNSPRVPVGLRRAGDVFARRFGRACRARSGEVRARRKGPCAAPRLSGGGAAAAAGRARGEPYPSWGVRTPTDRSVLCARKLRVPGSGDTLRAAVRAPSPFE